MEKEEIREKTISGIRWTYITTLLAKGLYPIIGIDGLFPALKELSESMEDLYKIGTPLSVDISHGGLKMTTDQEIKNDVQLHIVLSIVSIVRL